MLPKSERLKDKYLFNATFNIGKKNRQKLNSNLLTIYYLFKKKDINTLPRTSFICGLRIDKKANKRNLIKRRMRAAYQLIKKKLISTNKECLSSISVLIFIANPAIKDATFEQIKEMIQGLLARIVR